jgi:hypothetical protein
MCALELIFAYEHRDATEALNARLARVLQRGCYYGGRLTPVAGTLGCTRSPFSAVGFDGCTVRDTQYNTLTYTPGIDNYHCIEAKYNPQGTPSTPTINELVLSQAAYVAHPKVDYLIVLGRVQLAGGATEVLAADISYDVRDECGPLGRLIWKGTVGTGALLPLDVTVRVGDVWHVQADNGLYVWNGVTWELVTAKGAATLDGAYDDGGAGAGRIITADSGAVEIVQPITAEHVEDIANAALRIRQEDSSSGGSLGIDMVKNGSVAHHGGMFVREHLVFGTDIQAVEPIDVNVGVGGPIAFTRPACSLITYNYGSGIGAILVLVEITGSPSGINNGLFMLNVTGAQIADVYGTTGTVPMMVSEAGLSAKIFIIRAIYGSNYNNATFKLGAFTGNYELLGGAVPPSVYVGKTLAWLEGGTSKVFRGLFLDPGHTTEVFSMVETGHFTLTPEWYASDSVIDINTRESTAAVLIMNAGNTAQSDGILSRSTNLGSAALSGESIHGAGVRGVALASDGIGVEGSSFAFTADKTVTWALPMTFSAHPTYWSALWPGTEASAFQYQTLAVGVGPELTLVLQTSYFPEGCVIEQIYVDWEAIGTEVTGDDRMRMYAHHIRKNKWDAASATITTLAGMTGYLSFGSALAERRLDQLVCDQMQWTHGQNGSFSDMLRVAFRPRISGFGDVIYGVYVEARVRAVSQFAGPAVTP